MQSAAAACECRDSIAQKQQQVIELQHQQATGHTQAQSAALQLKQAQDSKADLEQRLQKAFQELTSSQQAQAEVSASLAFECSCHLCLILILVLILIFLYH